MVIVPLLEYCLEHFKLAAIAVIALNGSKPKFFKAETSLFLLFQNGYH